MNEKQLEAARKSMIDWLAHPQELGKAPYKIEFTESFEYEDRTYYIFKYKASALGKWLLGVAGGYTEDSLENTGHTFSEMEEYNESTAKEEAVVLIETVMDYWKKQAEEQETENKGTFVGFLLMDMGEWDKEKLISDVKEKWGIDLKKDWEGEADGDNLVFSCNSTIIAFSMIDAPIPDKEAEINAENNYMWPDAIKVAKKHKAQITVAVMDSEQSLVDTAKLYVKMVAACARQKHVTGIYTSGVVFEPSFYERFADVMKEGEDEIPVNNLIWIGLYRGKNGLCGYTYGMDAFNKDEMEVLDVDENENLMDLRDFLSNLATYVLMADVTLKDGETIGFSEEDKHKISRSEGVGLPGQMTLKISYEASDDDEEEEEDDDDPEIHVDEDEIIIMDDASLHLRSIDEKKLDTDRMNAYSHMALFLRLGIENNMMAPDFASTYGTLIESVKKEPGKTDLRMFIRYELSGKLDSSIFGDKAKTFISYYYGNGDFPSYLLDIDEHAVALIGEERNYSEEIQDEAYLFVPYDEKYYKEISKIIKKRFKNWKGQQIDPDTLEPSDLMTAMMEYLGCECKYFPSMKDDDPIMSAYLLAKREAVKEGYIPMLINEDETLWECLLLNSDPGSEGNEDYSFSKEKVAAYRKAMLQASLPDGRKVLEEYIDTRKEEAADDDIDWDEFHGKVEGGFNDYRFASYWAEDGTTVPLILAKIPVKNPWEVFAYLPFGNWNECPDTKELMAVSKYWYEKHGAVPAAMTHDVLQFDLRDNVVMKKYAMELAEEYYAFCPDVVDQAEDMNLGNLADTLRKSSKWYFWWD